MILLIDNYDSFVSTSHRLVRGGEKRRWSAATMRSTSKRFLLWSQPHSDQSGAVLPREAGFSTEVVRRVGPSIPNPAVSGHQCIRAAYTSGEIRRQVRPHSRERPPASTHSGAGIFSGLRLAFIASQVSSLVISPASVPPSLTVTARSEDGEIMAVQHVEYPVEGVQFHPESVLTEHGYRLLDQFLHGVSTIPRTLPQAADGVLVAQRSDASTLASAPRGRLSGILER